MTQKLIEKPTQEARVLAVLKEANGEYVNGRYFLQTMLLSQYHSRLWSLQKKGYKIEASEERDEFGFLSYKLTE